MKKRGRPPAAEKHEKHQLRFLPRDWALIERAAQALGVTTTDYVREAALRQAREDLER